MFKVLVPMTTRSDSSQEVGALNYARTSYVRQLVMRGVQPIFVSMLMTPDMIAASYAECQGIMLMGGGDIDARLYEHTNHALNNRAEPLRDVTEIALIRMAMTDRKPILGICRGMQAMAVAAGGTLHQHLPDIVEEEHGIGDGNGYEALLERAKHSVSIDVDSQVARILGVTEVAMNTGHHQAVATAGRRFRVTGRTPAGIAEFLEHADPTYFCIGVQGHPEAQDDTTTESLFNAFVGAVADLQHSQ